MPFTVYMPKLSPTMTEGTVAKWHKKVGDRVESGDVIVEISTDKATVEHAALDEGFLRAIVGNEGDKVQVNDPLCVFSETADEDISGFTPKPLGQKKEEPAAVKAAPVKEVVKQDVGARVMASPLAKKLAKEKNLDLATVAGSGPRGRIMSRDLSQQAAPCVQAVAQAPIATTPSATPFTLEPVTPMRHVIGTRLQESKSTIPHFYVKQEIDAAPIAALREELKRLEKNVTINDFIIKALAVALKKHPEINSGFDASKKSAMRYTRVDICVAVTVPGGLITPIVFDASRKSLSQISQEVKLLAAKARDGKLSPPEYQGGSFTLSNLGMFGIDEMTAIVNPPQGAILGVGAASDVPVVKNGQIVPGKRMSLTLSCDHRLIDGAEAAQFMRTLRELLENPILFLSE
ncbi:MAG: 2-oxo acid dehydrogenase subunit E2 [Verrucomicrobia bacterium]|nr:2-oxo acid dehydrogenase subunit E2 [Verrucomicrobiota bacterium]MBS0636519.1 2-oxo acid dehydrogenase subunit E2 [Verrucomicrobiota bacterium]